MLREQKKIKDRGERKREKSKEEQQNSESEGRQRTRERDEETERGALKQETCILCAQEIRNYLWVSFLTTTEALCVRGCLCSAQVSHRQLVLLISMLPSHESHSSLLFRNSCE